MIFAAGSPQEAWRVFESHYAVKSEDERERVEDEWNELSQKEGENIMFYGRAKAIRMKLQSYGGSLFLSSMPPDPAHCLSPLSLTILVARGVSGGEFAAVTGGGCVLDLSLIHI